MRGFGIVNMSRAAQLGRRNPRLAGRTTQAQLRWNSSPAKPVSPHVGFYKTFTRPIAKVMLMAVFTYQVAYWSWIRLEKDEIKAQKSAEIKELEDELQKLIKLAEEAGIKVKP